jgi:hypothetical protein
MYGSITITLADYPDAVSKGRACRQEVVLGYNDGVRVQVTQGLVGDELVIREGKSTVREGQVVVIAR